MWDWHPRCLARTEGGQKSGEVGPKRRVTQVLTIFSIRSEVRLTPLSPFYILVWKHWKPREILLKLIYWSNETCSAWAPRRYCAFTRTSSGFGWAAKLPTYASFSPLFDPHCKQKVHRPKTVHFFVCLSGDLAGGKEEGICYLYLKGKKIHIKFYIPIFPWNVQKSGD